MQSQFQLGGDDEFTHQILSYGLLFLTFYRFPYTAGPLTSTAPTRPSRDRYRLYPIPIAPSVRYHVRDLSYDLWTTSLHFPFLVFSLYPTHSSVVRPIADHRTTRSGPYHTLRRTRTLCSFYLSFVFKTFVSTPKKKEVFPQNSDLSSLCLIVSLRSVFASLHLHTFAPSLYLVLPTPFALSHHSEPPSRTTSHSLILGGRGPVPGIHESFRL